MKILYLILILIVSVSITSCRESEKENMQQSHETKMMDSVVTIVKSKNTKGFCTQMPSYNLANAFLYAAKMQTTELISGEMKTIDLKDYNQWSKNINTQFSEMDQWDSIATILNSDTNVKVMENYFKVDGAILLSTIWSKNNLKVKFINGTQDLQDEVMRHAKEWEKWCAIRFETVISGQADITVSFKEDGFWSYVGNESLKHTPSMSLTDIQNETPTRLRSTVIHEFGHALGLIHEHQNPESQLEWNVAEVVAYYKDTQNWDETEVYDNVIYRYKINQCNATKFDPKSIMIYEIPSWMLKNNNGYGYQENHELSYNDKQLIRKKYR